VDRSDLCTYNFIQNIQNVNFWQCNVGFKLGCGMVHIVAIIGFVLILVLIILNSKCAI
jgi:hypothetical protein